MVGIINCGAYIPFWRLSRRALRDGLTGEKAIAGFDEDSITMAVAATLDCLNGIDRQAVDGLFFSSTTSPYKEKLGATIVATAADLRRDIITADFSNSLRAGTISLRAAIDAVKSGSAKQVLVVAADCRLGAPGSNWESSLGDGAAAFLIGASEVIAEVEAIHSICNEMMDIWRTEDDRFMRSSDSRFVASEGYSRVSREAIAGILKSSNLKAEDFNKAVFGLPDSKAQVALAKAMGFDVKTHLQDSLSSWVGDTGAAYSFILLQAALENAKENDRVLWLNYGNGSDAISLRVTDRIINWPKKKVISRYFESKNTIEDYRVYARWRGLLPSERPSPCLGIAAPPALWREVEGNIRLYGVKCNVCHTIQYPPQAVCTKCHAKDQFEKVRLSDKKGRLVTYSIDYVNWSLEMPTITAVVNFEGGGRIQCLMSEAKGEELKLDMPVTMSFRKLDFREGINIYSWKCIPARY